jgi:hypothetical protein
MMGKSGSTLPETSAEATPSARTGTHRNWTDRSNVGRLLCYDFVIENSVFRQSLYGSLRVLGVIEYPNGDGSYFRCICHL